MPTRNHKYILVNKPYGVLPQFTDKLGRPTLSGFITLKNIYPVGRLDLDSEGLLLLTDDNKLNHFLSTSQSKQPKTYWAQVEGVPDEKKLQTLRQGVMIEGKKTLPARVRQIAEPLDLWERPVPIRFRKTVPTSWLEITLVEGRNRQVRRMTAKVGLPCLRLVRVGIGDYKLEGLKPGEYREVQAPTRFTS